MVILNYDEELFALYAFYVTILTLKLIFLSALTSVTRLFHQTFANFEDASFFNTKINLSDKFVERIRRAHLNDLENIPAFWILGFLYVLSGPLPIVALSCFRIFTAARIIYTTAYLLGISSVRGPAFMVGLIINIYMGINIVFTLLW